MNRKVDTNLCPFCNSKVQCLQSQLTSGKILIYFKCQNPDCGATVSFDNLTANHIPARAKEFFKRRQISEE